MRRFENQTRKCWTCGDLFTASSEDERECEICTRMHESLPWVRDWVLKVIDQKIREFMNDSDA